MIFRKTSSCRHDLITPDRKAGYCTDCGEYVENHWYITRCKCCGIKQNTKIVQGKILANTRYCKNCGSNSFIIEELEIIDIVNINYAVLLKQIIGHRKQNIIQTWLEQNSYTPLKLLPSY